MDKREAVCCFENSQLHEHWTKLDDPKTTMVLQKMEQLLVPLGTPSRRHRLTHWLQNKSLEEPHHPVMSSFVHVDVRDHTSMHACVHMTSECNSRTHSASGRIQHAHHRSRRKRPTASGVKKHEISLQRNPWNFQFNPI